MPPIFWLLVYLPDDFRPVPKAGRRGRPRDSTRLNKEIDCCRRQEIRALRPWVRESRCEPQTDGGVLITDGVPLRTKEHIGGVFWILECADMDEAGGVHGARKRPVRRPLGGRSRCAIESFFNPATALAPN